MSRTFTQAEMDIAVRAERHRFQLVMGSVEYRGRETAALHMLQNTDLTSEAIIGALSGMTRGNPQQSPSSGVQGGQSDFQKGAAIASSLPPGMRK